VQPFKHYSLEGFFILQDGVEPELNHFQINRTMALTLNLSMKK